jgi:hypothetical protein
MERKPPIRLYKACELILEDVPAGCTVVKSDFKTSSTVLKEGALLGIDTNGIGHIVKTAKVFVGAASGATTVRVYKTNEFKVGNYLINTPRTGISRAIISIDEESSFSYDDIELNAPLGIALLTDAVLVEVSTGGVSGSNAILKYPPTGISICDNPVDLLRANTGCGLMVRGRIKESLMPYPIDDSLKAMLPLIRFVE